VNSSRYETVKPACVSKGSRRVGPFETATAISRWLSKAPWAQFQIVA